MTNKKLIASSSSIEGLATLLQKYFYSSSIKIDADTLTVSNSVKNLDVHIEKKRNRFLAKY